MTSAFDCCHYAAFLYAQRENVDTVNTKRLSLFQTYQDAFADPEVGERLERPRTPADTTGNGHMFYLLLRDRAAFIAHMSGVHIYASFHYVPLHSAPAGQHLSRIFGDLSFLARLVRLPMYFKLDLQINEVIEAPMGYLEKLV